MTDNSIIISVPDAHIREHERFVVKFHAIERGKEAIEFVERRERWTMNDGEYYLFDLLPDAFDQRGE